MRFVVANYGDRKRRAWVDIETKMRAAEDTKIGEFGISAVSHKF